MTAVEFPPRVLIVEDEWLLAETLSESLRDMGFEIAGAARSVADALALIACETISVAVLDVSLSATEKSFPVALALQDKNIPFLFMTGYQAVDLPAEFKDEVVLGKPSNFELLQLALEKLLLGAQPGVRA
jgi:DNA-binding response OmpR family regulator